MLLSSPLENFYIELITPLNNESPLQRSIIKRGEGFHHICYKVDNLHTKIQDLKNLGVSMLPNYPRIGSRNKKICFLDPSSTGKILVELAEMPN
jgi:methylmalonyl-CoA/ethylmalonyl-CoA epimerase